jgi:hypothetical protein
MSADSVRAEARKDARRRLSGLGKGLAEILPTDGSVASETFVLRHGASRAVTDGPGPEDSIDLPAEQHRLLFADLETVADVLAIDLCAYLYRPAGEGFRLVVATRPAAAPAPASFALLDLMRESGPSVEQSVSVDPYQCTMITTSGRRSSGVLLIGKLQGRLTSTELKLAWRLCRLGALAAVLD